ncbi:histidine phosphatase family protein [Thiocapsa imhoffii]|uniref:Histidine phosphatase family protein n=1 Tax=Thiocapsa imhoffii TaxID=382777 RepID=A0A9X0WKZ1_9GAMM|nr:histidine phosphatase family protein [Thiocapsa imhoffii]MBK1646436.1 histidine phosphatase family protein [Thiocapsa imhoffii]
MNTEFPLVYLVRHGETEWSRAGQHTGLTDIPLTAQGEREAESLAARLQHIKFSTVLVSPLIRARRTCELAGFEAVAQVDPDLVEWDYGDYEGLTTREIRVNHPDWRIFYDGCPGGETLDQIGLRADRVIAKVKAADGHVLLFSSGHFLRVFAARWLDLKPDAGRFFMLGTTGLSALGYEHDRTEPVIRFWDKADHVAEQPSRAR